MPYIIITTPRSPRSGILVPQGAARRAVATLDEAREYSFQIVMDDLEGNGPTYDEPGKAQATALAAHRLPESGGTIGPLPDGTMIKVQHVTWHDLIEAVGSGIPQLPESPAERTEILDAYNAR